MKRRKKQMVKVNGWKEMPEAIGGVCAEERETIIRKDRADGLAHVCTTDHVEYARLLGKCKAHPAEYSAIGYEICGGQPQVGYFDCPAGMVRYATPASDAQRAAARANAEKAAAALAKANADKAAKAGK